MADGIATEVWSRMSESAQKAVIDLAHIFAAKEDATVQIIARAGGCRDFQVTVPVATLSRGRGT